MSGPYSLHNYFTYWVLGNPYLLLSDISETPVYSLRNGKESREQRTTHSSIPHIVTVWSPRQPLRLVPLSTASVLERGSLAGTPQFIDRQLKIAERCTYHGSKHSYPAFPEALASIILIDANLAFDCTPRLHHQSSSSSLSHRDPSCVAVHRLSSWQSKRS